MAAAAMLLSACGEVRREDAWAGVAATVQERMPERLHWNTGTEADREAQQAVDRLLGRELDVDAAVQVALLANRDLQATYASLGIAQADLVQAGLLRNPVFEGTVRFGAEGTGLELSLVQEFISLLHLPLRRRLAAAALEQAQLEAAGAVLGLAGQVRAAFRTHQGDVQEADLRRTGLQAATAAHVLAQRLHAAGNITDLALAQQRAQHEEARLELAEAELRIEEGRERLNGLLGLWGAGTAWRVAARLPDPPDTIVAPADVEGRAVAANLGLAARRQALIASAQRFGRYVPWWLDDIEIGAEAEREPGGGWAAGPTVAIPVPAFDRGGPMAASARISLARERERHAGLAIRIRAQARLGQARLQVAHERARFLRRILLPLRQAIVTHTQLQYNAMQLSAFQLLSARRQELAAEIAWMRAVRDYWLAHDRMELLLDGRLADDDAVDRTDGTGPSGQATDDRPGH